MASERDSGLWRFCWYGLFVGLTLIGIQMFVMGYLLAGRKVTANGWSVGAATFLMLAVAVFGFAVLLLTRKNIQSIHDTSELLEDVSEIAKKNRDILGRVERMMRLSNTAREIVFQDAERMELAEAVLAKIQQRDFDGTEKIIKLIAAQPQYGDLADQLLRRLEAFRNGTEEEQINQIVAHIQELCDGYNWGQASARIVKLLKDFPDSIKAKSALEDFHRKKDMRKRGLIGAWDAAVRDGDTDRSLEILKELDLYLTPSEGLALQESASSVFKTKLHNLGVEFSVAVTEQNWGKALEAGEQITANFPNSRMAQEIRGKIGILRQRAKG